MNSRLNLSINLKWRHYWNDTSSVASCHPDSLGQKNKNKGGKFQLWGQRDKDLWSTVMERKSLPEAQIIFLTFIMCVLTIWYWFSDRVWPAF
jgi:hypothetical protein